MYVCACVHVSFSTSGDDPPNPLVREINFIKLTEPSSLSLSLFRLSRFTVVPPAHEHFSPFDYHHVPRSPRPAPMRNYGRADVILEGASSRGCSHLLDIFRHFLRQESFAQLLRDDDNDVDFDVPQNL